MLSRNPYLNRSMIRSLDGFYGRDRQIERIMARLGDATPQSVSIVGQRRIGKSSLLWHLAQPEIQAQHLDDPATYLFVYLDFQGHRHLDLSGFSAAWGRQVADAASDHVQLVEATDLSDLETQVQQLTEAGLRLVGLFDEFETVTQSSAFGAEFFGFLRSLANSYPVAFVTASRRELQALCRSQEISESPFFNIFSRVQLGPLDTQAVGRLICEPSAGLDHPLAPHQDLIESLAGQLPLFVQMACSAAMECLQEEDGQLNEKRLVRRFRDEADGHLQYLWEHMEQTQQGVLRGLLAGDCETQPDEAALRHLIDDGFVRMTQNGPRVFSDVLGAVLAEAGILEAASRRRVIAPLSATDNGSPQRPAAHSDEEEPGESHVLELAPVPIGAHPFSHIVGQSEPLRRVFSFVQRAAQSDVTVLLLGETGTGKELIARTIHEQGSRSAGPFVVVNCGAIAEHLQESELFGHKKGAFTDASSDREGLFEAANGGTLLLDEIGETTPSTQVKLLRVLQEGEVRRVGDSHPRKVDVRVICATNRNLEAEVEAGRFRQDLYYRLFVLVTRLPSLAQRADDIQPLVAHFLAGKQIDADALALLQAYWWPGNVRELENQLAGAAAIAADGAIRREHLWPRLQRLEGAQVTPIAAVAESPTDQAATVRTNGLTLRDARDAFERQLLLERMAQLDSEPTRVAKSLGISRSRLYELIRKHDLGR